MDSKTDQAQTRLQGGTYSASGEVLDYTMYDRQQIDAAILQHRFFTQGLGKPMSTGVIKTLADSNVISDGIPQGQKFTVRAIKMHYVGDKIRNNAEMQSIIDLLAQSVMTFKITGKDVILQMTLMELMGNNFPVLTVPTVAGDNPRDHMTSIIRTAYPLNIPIVLASLTRFEILVEHFEAPAAGLDNDLIALSLQGALERLA